MAEVIGPIGFCFGCIGFVLSTIPTAAKALDDYLQCVEYFRSYEVRLVRSKTRADKWNIYWRQMSDFGEHEAVIQQTKEDIEGLCRAIENEIAINMTDEKERKTWKHIRASLRRGRFRKPKDGEKTVDFARSVGFVLYEKSHIEGWITRLETAIECIEKVSEIAFAKRTAEHFSGSPTRAQVRETKELEDFLQGLTSLAQRLYDESIATAIGPEQQTYGWGLGLRPPAIAVEHWKFIAEIHIEIQYSTLQSVHDNKHFYIDVPFHKDDKRTHLSSEQIKHLVRGHTASDVSKNTVPAAAKCSAQHSNARRTRPIGDLLKHAPKLFLNEAWRKDRATLVKGLSHWALLLWDTAWMKDLCCYGLQIEKGVVGKECIAQIFNVGECPKHDMCHHGSRLRNLGLVLAQLVLGTLIRRKSQNSPAEYQQWIDGDWKVLYRSDIIAEVFTKTTSTPLSDAIRFCLGDDSALENGPFQHGFMLECIDRIYKPLNKWYETESRSLDVRTEPEHVDQNVPQNERWPEEAMCQVWEAPHTEKLLPHSSEHLLEQRKVAYRSIWTVLYTWPVFNRFLLGVILSMLVAISLFPHDSSLPWQWRHNRGEQWSSARQLLKS